MTVRKDIRLPCQYCGKLERRAATSVHRTATCFDCRAARIRKAAMARLHAARGKPASDDHASFSCGSPGGFGTDRG
jgi:hypothetical protein